MSSSFHGSCKELTAKCNVLGRGEGRALRKLGKAKEKIKKLKATIQELKTAVELKDNEVSRALKASKKTILEGDVLNDVDWNSNSSSISEDLAVEKNYFSRSEAASDTRSEVHRPCNKNGVSGSKSAFWTNEDWEVNLAETPVSKVMTRNLVFVLYNTLAVEALQKMVLGKFRHLPIVESGEVIALLDIAKCLYNSIARMERAAKKGKAIAATVEGVEKQWGASIVGPNTFIETLRDQMFRPFCLQSFLRIQSRIATVSPTDTMLMATKKMVEYGPCQFSIRSKDILMQVIAQNLPPESTPVEKVMTPNPECATVDTPIVDALHIMHDGKFLHLPVVDKDGVAVAVVDVLHITHAAIATISPLSFGDHQLSCMSLSDNSFKLAFESIETTRSLPYPSSIVPNTFGFKIQDKKGRMHRFNCDTRSLTDLVTAILQRVGDEIDRNNLPPILYEDKDHDNVLLASDSDLAAAVDRARLAGWKVLKLHLDHSGTQGHGRGSQSVGVEYAQSDLWASAYNALAPGAALIAGLSMLAYLRRNGN
ncbi:CBS domain-containing protein CBSCBSPB5 [Camellia lanceoleosa]|uniref:CBS domain-containing protein CBSCBSPB5 n=1 Tax=Camellia lanceoleosa TaxID=1840588 RepID=A0ACC0GFR5_9ERIC|nr:CBS domain-containing protein CBSCBSPB5 [Camellia lanceoleosa]